MVEDYLLADNPDEEYLALGTTDLRRVAVVDRRFADLLGEDLKHDDPTGTVQLTEYRPNRVTYRASLDQRTLVLFSDSYYEGGWHATVDGEPVEHLRANYILRGLPVDAGEHEIVFEFIFEPYEKGQKIALAGSILVGLILLGGLLYLIRPGMFPGGKREDQA
jgi:hypothetical protein